jgi:predicted RNA-binding protein YlqC (UPF0109 family)
MVVPQFKLASSATLLLLLCSKWQSNEAFQAHLHRHLHRHQSIATKTITTITTKPTSLFGEKYTKGAEIFPATNEERFKLTDSFPNGELPPSVQQVIDNQEQKIAEEEEASNSDTGIDNDSDDVSTEISSSSSSSSSSSLSSSSTETPKIIPKRTRVRKAIQTILRSAAESETETGKTPLINSNPINKRPPLTAIFLMTLGLIKPNHFLSVVFISGYLIALALLASSPKSVDNMNPIVWSVPPQGHVPSLLSNPLGMIGNNQSYFTWLRIGEVFGYITPFLYLFKTVLAGHKHLSETIASNVFLISCQIMTEEMSRKVLTPLPIRVLIPLLYNALRMGPLYEWMMCWSTMNSFGRLLSLANFVYWGMNLFLFLIPIATMKYMRSYFFCVEAEEVVVRDGDEDHIGLLGR